MRTYQPVRWQRHELNRTYVELKLVSQDLERAANIELNRTYVELKSTPCTNSGSGL